MRSGSSGSPTGDEAVACDDVPVKTPRCDRCSGPAVFHDKKTGRHLCREHFIADIEKRVADTIRSKNLIIPGDHVVIALSGGKDSTALLMILARLLPSWDSVRLSAVTIDEGIAGYREDTIRSADRLVMQYGLDHASISFTELFGGTLDAFLKGREPEACSVCGILRRKALNVAADRAGATKLATGHNLDDEAQSVFMNVLRGDLPRLVRDSGSDSKGRFIPRIKPLMFISEKEIAVYLMLHGAWADLPECPYAVHALRGEVRGMLASLESKYPGTMLHLMESKTRIEAQCAGRLEEEPVRHCRECGDSCSGEICQLCTLKKTLSQ
ncbi:MAG: TIGR00269 family protein [Methanoregula sp.]|uniref:TIGR00269 family protein n=1 Tax=Methanoregula sp. TaxID=2052170 RepID=UPI0025F1702A|nr:TIGR00269 family protein [Methanoregula sp.]MCK9630465.1 TIGR00269 family protein [Methanoregula sp.]